MTNVLSNDVYFTGADSMESASARGAANDGASRAAARMAATGLEQKGRDMGVACVSGGAGRVS